MVCFADWILAGACLDDCIYLRGGLKQRIVPLAVTGTGVGGNDGSRRASASGE